MAITKEIEIGKIEVVGPYKHVQVRTDTIIREDGKELSRSYHRHVVENGDYRTIDGSQVWTETDISGEDASVQSICNAVWTQAIKDAWKAKIDADNTEFA